MVFKSVAGLPLILAQLSYEIALYIHFIHQLPSPLIQYIHFLSLFQKNHLHIGSEDTQLCILKCFLYGCMYALVHSCLHACYSSCLDLLPCLSVFICFCALYSFLLASQDVAVLQNTATVCRCECACMHVNQTLSINITSMD